MKLNKRRFLHFSLRKKINIYLSLTASVICASTLSWALASCTSSQKQSAISSLIDTGSGSRFFGNSGDSGSLNSIATNSLQDENGYNAYLKYEIGKILQFWFKNNVANIYQTDYKDFQKSVNTSWDDKVTAAKNSYREGYEINLRTETLDKSGANNVADWKTLEMNDKVISRFTSDAFGVDYLGFVKSPQSSQKYSIGEISPDSLNDTRNWGNFKFVANTTDESATNGYNLKVAQTYAEFQNSVFDDWVKKNLPLLVSDVLYKNGQPKEGLTEVFNKSIYSGNGPSLSPSYQFQVFPSINENQGESDTQKFTANGLFDLFLRNHASFYDATTGGVNIPKAYTEDNSSGIFLQSTKMYDDLYLPFSASVAYLLMDKIGALTADESIRNVSFDSLVKDNIMANFIFQNNGQTKKWWGFSNPSYFDHILAPELLKNSQSNPYGFYAQLANPNGSPYSDKTFSIADLFTTSDTNNIEWMFARDGNKDGAGVHIITIDGLNYFASSSGIDIGKLEQFLMYRSLQKTCGFTSPDKKGNDTTFNIKDNTGTYFGSSESKKLALIADFLRKQIVDQKASSFINAVSGDQNQNELVKQIETVFGTQSKPSVVAQFYQAWRSYFFDDQLLKSRQKVRSTIVANAKTYDDNIKNAKPDANGIAGRLPFQMNASNGMIPTLERFFVPQENSANIWWASANQDSKKPLPSANLPTIAQFDKTLVNLKETINNYALNLVSKLGLKKSTSTTYADYTQCIYTDNPAINSAINAVLTSSSTPNSVLNDYQWNLLKQASNYSFEQSEAARNYQILKVNPITGDIAFKNPVAGDNNLDLLNTIINSYYLKSVFSNNVNGGSILKFGVLNQISNTNNYIHTLWKNAYESGSSDAINYLLFLNTLDYLLSPINAKSGGGINLTNYLASDISVGASSYVTWITTTNLANDKKLVVSDVEKMLSTPMTSNVDYDFGSLENYLNLASTSNLPKPDRYLLDSIYRSSPTILVDGEQSNLPINYYGFFGLITPTLTSNLPSDVSKILFDPNFHQATTSGAFASYGNEQDLIAMIKAKSNALDVQAFASVLHSLVPQMDVSNVVGENSLTTSVLQDNLINDLRVIAGTIPNLFAPLNGFITGNGGFVSSNSQSWTDPQSSLVIVPIQDSSKTKMGYLTYIRQITNREVVDVKTSWMSDPAARLGLPLQTFLAIAADYAMNNASAQQAALNRLVGNRVQVYDSRLMSLLTSQWVYTKNKGE